jgi:hypothetical protein
MSGNSNKVLAEDHKYDGKGVRWNLPQFDGHFKNIPIKKTFLCEIQKSEDREKEKIHDARFTMKRKNVR